MYINDTIGFRFEARRFFKLNVTFSWYVAIKFQIVVMGQDQFVFSTTTTTIYLYIYIYKKETLAYVLYFFEKQILRNADTTT